MSYRMGNFYKLLIMTMDINIVLLSYIAAFAIRFANNVPEPAWEAYFDSIPYICIITVTLFYIYGMYSILFRSLFETIISIALIVAILSISSMSIAFVLRGFGFPRTIFLIAALIQFISLAIWRAVILVLRRRAFGRKDVIIIGNNPEMGEILKKILINSTNLYNIKYAFDARNDFSLAKDLIDKVDFVFICSNVSYDYKHKILSYCLKKAKHLFVVPDLFEISLSNIIIRPFDDVPTFFIESFSFSFEQKIFKRVADLVFSIIGLIILSPLMLAIAAAIKLTSPGPVLYGQSRITINNKVFKLYKFRTMITDAESMTGPVLAAENDPRITRVGRFLRSARLDELPQLLNVLTGDMSIVGPRPERPYFVDKYRESLPEYDFRHTVKAGLTGLAQVSGKYSTSVEDKLRYDLLYIKKYSAWLDAILIFQTMRTIFMKNSSKGLNSEKSLEKALAEAGCTIIDNGESIQIQHHS